MSGFVRVTVASRVFCIAVIFGLGVIARDTETLLSLAVVAFAASTAIYLTVATPVATALVVTVEATLTGLLISLALPSSVVFLPYLVVLTLIAGISAGLVGVSAVVTAQFATIFAITSLSPRGTAFARVFELLSPWMITSIGLGLLGSWLATVSRTSPQSIDDASYQSAHRLLTQLRTVARRLSSGLDPVSAGAQILNLVQRRTVAGAGVLLVRTDGGLLSPLAQSGVDDEVIASAASLEVTEACWLEMEPTFGLPSHPSERTIMALPLRVGSRMIGVVVVSTEIRPSSTLMKDVMRELDDRSIRLETAMIFDEVRTLATVEERRRLAREIHDGIAQEVASMGYLVDDLIASAASDAQAANLVRLREEMTRVVSELRLSIFDLRSEVLPETGLGVALGEYLRRVGSQSSITVHLTLNEAPTRLRTESETHLLRIAQEAITNARKHSGAENLWVTCQVAPPFAHLQVRDDGVGPTDAGDDSYGLRIMKERAQRIDGELTIRRSCASVERPGTVVEVTIGGGAATIPGENEVGRCHS